MSALQKPVWRSLRKPEIELAYEPAILLMVIYSKEMKTLN